MCVCKQKTAYEMRISDWSSDVCSSDLHRAHHNGEILPMHRTPGQLLDQPGVGALAARDHHYPGGVLVEPVHTARARQRCKVIGLASRRERGGPFVYITVVAVSLKKTNSLNYNDLPPKHNLNSIQ